ncbi:hypothetical protein LDENG_00052060 [Lucifuga dentata]|nr:hypothetical protein LDENG_00052060 [Lucifuga dentata]
MDTAAPLRSIIVRFLDFTVKEAILHQAWSQKQLTVQGKPIYFDHDYSPELQKKRAQIRFIIKQLKMKGIHAKCPYPAQLRINLETGEKTFSTLTDAAPTLKELGIEVCIEERDRLERECRDDRWSQERGRRRKDASLSASDFKAFF